MKSKNSFTIKLGHMRTFHGVKIEFCVKGTLRKNIENHALAFVEIPSRNYYGVVGSSHSMSLCVSVLLIQAIMS